jgi:uncharacterized protein YcaQ
MSRASGRPVPLSVSTARRIWIRAQRLDQRSPFGEGPDAVAEAVAHLGYVQIDTINVIERCHHHILFTRIPAYRRADLGRAQSADKSVFEYWTHAQAYVPSADFRYFITDMKQHRLNRDRWFASVTAADSRKVMRLVRKGPLTLRDIEDDELREKDHAWASKKPSKRALHLAFFEGRLAISARTGMLKTYDLIERHFGWDRLPKAATAAEVAAYLLDRALRSQGVVSLDSICHLDAPSKGAVKRIIDARVRKGELVAVALDGAKHPHWAAPDTLAASYEPNDLVHILSPFDPLMIQRKRSELFFGYGHRFEAYVPKEKRVLGYFALPVLAGDAIVAALDLKTDRQNRKLLMQQWTWIGDAHKRANAALRKALKVRIEDELGRFEKFQLGE